MSGGVRITLLTPAEELAYWAFRNIPTDFFIIYERRKILPVGIVVHSALLVLWL